MALDALKKALNGNLKDNKSIPFWSWNNALDEKELVIKKFASSPAHKDDELMQRKLSFKRHTSTPSTGPSKKEMSNMNKFPKSSFKNSAPKRGMGISKKLTA